MSDKYTLMDATAEEMVLFYSSREPGRNQETGCIGHLRQDFGRDGKGFWTTWEDHCPELKTQVFKDEFDVVINALRESVLKDRAALSAYCREHPQAKLNDGRDHNYGFKLKTDSHVFYLRLCPLENDYNLYCYTYNRETLEKRFPSLAETVMTDELRKAAAFIVEKSANETTSGNYIISADDIPTDILSPELFEQYIADIAAIMEEYEAVADVGLTSNGEIDVIIYSDYCPNYEPLPEEQGDFSPDRPIFDPLETRKVNVRPVNTETVQGNKTDRKPTLAERLEKNKQKAAAQSKSTANKSKKREELT